MSARTENGGGVIREILSTSAFKDILRNITSHVDHSGARRFTAGLIWGDVELTLAALGTLPGLANSILEAATEIAVQVRGKFSPLLLKNFVMSLAEDVNSDTARECGEEWGNLLTDLLKESPEIYDALPAVIADGINRATSAINAGCRNDPEALGRFISQITSRVDSRQLSDATRHIAESVLDRKPIRPVIPWTGKLITARFKKRLNIKTADSQIRRIQRTT